jgi:hypothetical protein
VQKEFKCRVEFDGQLLEAVPCKLLSKSEANPTGHTDMKCIVVPADVKPSNISLAQAAKAVFDTTFKDALVKPTWEMVTAKLFSEEESKDLFVQEISFPEEGSTGAGAEDDKAGSGAGADGDKAGEEKSDRDKGASKPASGDWAGDSKAGAGKKVCMEFIVYLKQKDRLIACQFLPAKATEQELTDTVKKFIPVLRAVLEHP